MINLPFVEQKVPDAVTTDLYVKSLYIAKISLKFTKLAKNINQARHESNLN